MIYIKPSDTYCPQCDALLHKNLNNTLVQCNNCMEDNQVIQFTIQQVISNQSIEYTPIEI